MLIAGIESIVDFSVLHPSATMTVAGTSDFTSRIACRRLKRFLRFVAGFRRENFGSTALAINLHSTRLRHTCHQRAAEARGQHQTHRQQSRLNHVPHRFDPSSFAAHLANSGRPQAFEYTFPQLPGNPCAVAPSISTPPSMAIAESSSRLRTPSPFSFAFFFRCGVACLGRLSAHACAINLPAASRSAVEVAFDPTRPQRQAADQHAEGDQRLQQEFQAPSPEAAEPSGSPARP